MPQFKIDSYLVKRANDNRRKRFLDDFAHLNRLPDQKIDTDETPLRACAFLAAARSTCEPKGPIKFHIADVLLNVDRFFIDSPDRGTLKLITLVHDTFKARS